MIKRNAFTELAKEKAPNWAALKLLASTTNTTAFKACDTKPPTIAVPEPRTRDLNTALVDRVSVLRSLSFCASLTEDLRTPFVWLIEPRSETQIELLHFASSGKPPVPGILDYSLAAKSASSISTEARFDPLQRHQNLFYAGGSFASSLTG